MITKYEYKIRVTFLESGEKKIFEATLVGNYNDAIKKLQEIKKDENVTLIEVFENGKLCYIYRNSAACENKEEKNDNKQCPEISSQKRNF